MKDNWPPAVRILVAVKEKFKKDRKLAGSLDCPVCGEKVNYAIAPGNHHARAKCNGCGVSFME